jgi:hypothetical protein
MEYFAGASDQTIWESGLTRAGYARALQAQERQRTLESQRAANTVSNHEGRRSDRFMGAGEAGIPISKHRLSEENRRVTEQQATELYRRIVLHKRAGIPVDHDKAALGNLLGYRVGTIREFEDYFHSDAARERFGEIG